MTGLGPFHRAWRMLPPGARRRALAEGAAWLAGSVAEPPPSASGGLILVGEMVAPNGLGSGARVFATALRALGVPLWEVDIGSPIGRGALAIPVGAPVDSGLFVHVNAPLLPLTLLRLGKPRRRVLAYWAQELPVAGADWRAGARCVHDVWCNSAHAAAALEPLKPGRVRAVPPPVAAAPPEPSGLGRADFGIRGDAVLVLVSFNLASSFARKNPDGAIAAFRDAFGAARDRLLLMKVGGTAHYPEDFARLRALARDAPNIRFETRDFDTADNAALTACADIVLSLHRAEGFGSVPAEAMLLGRPVVMTGWSGNMEYCDADSAALVPYRLVAARDPRGVFQTPGAVWAEPEHAAAVAQLRRLADNAALRAALGARGRAHATAALGTATLRAALGTLGLA